MTGTISRGTNSIFNYDACGNTSDSCTHEESKIHCQGWIYWIVSHRYWFMKNHGQTCVSGDETSNLGGSSFKKKKRSFMVVDNMRMMML